jgi:very-short-patch-repair endonuclease
MTLDDHPLPARILQALRDNPGQRSADLAARLSAERKDVNRILTQDLAGKVHQGADYRWRLIETTRPQPTVAAGKPGSEIARLSRYYLECIGQDMDEGLSVFAHNAYGETDYAELPCLPLGGAGDGWFNAPGVRRILGKVREDRAKLVAWLGYPVRLRRHRTPRWEGFFVEPVLLWRITPDDQQDEPPRIDDEAPLPNAKFLRSFALGDAQQLVDETARLVDELGLAAPAQDQPEVDELIARLARIRPDWDWREALDPAGCSTGTALAGIHKQGIYNRSVVLSGERSPFTQGLETELKVMGDMADGQLNGSALGHWLAGGAGTPAGAPADDEPLLEVLPMNAEQRAAVRTALHAPHTVVTGPPGTGKSQVVTNLLVNAAWRGKKVLFASKNNKAVDVVEARVNGLGNRPVLLRLGAKEYQSRMAGYLTQLLAGNPSQEDRHNYDESLQRHRSLAARMAELDRTQQATLDARNIADQRDADADDARQLFPGRLHRVDDGFLQQATEAMRRFDNALARADVGRQGLPVRLLWGLLGKGRLHDLATALTQAQPVLLVLGIAAPKDLVTATIPDLTRIAGIWRTRLAAAEKICQARRALQALQACVPFEAIATQRAALTEQIAQNSQRLWREWVQLAPSRLSAEQRRDVADYAAALQLLAGQDAGRIHPAARQRARQLQSRVTELFSCWAVTSLSARGRVPFEAGYFDLVVIDEASQCDIASALPMLYRARRSVVIGDPQQLRHISALSRPRDTELQHKYGLTDTRVAWMYAVSSLYDVAASVVAQHNIVSLLDHHRSHADIIGFSNRTFYEGRLRVGTRYQRLKRPRNAEPGIVWQDVHGQVTRPANGGAQNLQEAEALVGALEDLLVTRGYGGTVGVVTPFRAQAQLLQQLLESSEALVPVRAAADLLVDTVHRFQGDERDVMFFSPVIAAGMAPGSLGFLRSNGNLFNVAITRARGLLHVVGDREAAMSCGVDYLADFAGYVASLQAKRRPDARAAPAQPQGPDYPPVARPEQVSDWERRLYRALHVAGVRPIPQYTVEQYDLDFAVIIGERRLNIEVDGERYHRSWTGELCLRDQLRNQRLIELGWEVRRFWVYEVRDHLEDCVGAVRAWVEGGPA